MTLIKKSLVIHLLILLILSGCNSANNSDNFKDIIKKNIIENALGVDLKPEFDSVVLVHKYSVKEVIKTWIENDGNTKNIDELINELKDVDNHKGMDQYEFFKWKKERLIKLKTLKPEEVIYDVIKAYYKINNPLLGSKVSVLNYYIISENQIIGMLQENEMKEVVKNQTNIGFAYEYTIFANKKVKLP